MDKREEENENPPTVIGKPVPPMSFGELMAWHERNGTLAEFLVRVEYSRDR